MPNKQTDILFHLIKSLNKAEKRNFKLFVSRNTSVENLKSVQLFDGMDSLTEYDEDKLLKKQKGLLKQQLPNLKAQLYKQLLSSLVVLENDDNIDIKLHKQMDFARILYNKGMYLHAIKQLEKVKEIANYTHQHTFLLQALFFEKKIELLFITRSFKNRADVLSKEVEEVTERISLTGHLSNLSLKLYAWYINNGHAKHEEQIEEIQLLFFKNLPQQAIKANGFYEKLYLSQSYCWYYFVLQDYLNFYKYAYKWLQVFEQNPIMKQVESLYYIKAFHNVIYAHYMLGNHSKYVETLQKFKDFFESSISKKNDKNQIQAFLYYYTALINLYFLEGNFTKGTALVPHIEEGLKHYASKIDKHRQLVFYYKIACLYFGSGDSETCIDYLNKIINSKTDLRTDLQCYSRLLLLIAHFELGNFNLLEYLLKSVYRYMAKMGNLNAVELQIFQFLKQSFNLSPKHTKKAFKTLYDQLLPYQNNKMDSRAFAYLDIMSWLKSKITNVPVQTIVQKNFAASQKPNRSK